MCSSDRADRVREAVQGSVRDLGLVVEDVTVIPAGKRRLVRILVDRDVESIPAPEDTTPIASLTLDEVAEATRRVGAALDDSDAMGASPYVLEVSSPGVDRPLTQPRHFRRNVGRLVVVARTGGADVTGRLTSAGPDGITLDAAPARAAKGAVDTSPGHSVQLPYAEISRAQVQVEFDRGTDREDH